MEFEMEGFDEFIGELEDLQQRTNDLYGENQVGFDELFTDSFMLKYTNFNSIDQMFEKSDFNIESEEDFDEIPEKELDKYVNENTVFSSWGDMAEKATAEWASKQLGL